MPAKKKSKKKKSGRPSYKIPPGQFKWKPWAGPKCPNVHCEDSRESVEGRSSRRGEGRSSRRGYSPTRRGHFAAFEVECFDCGHIQYMSSALRPVRPPEGWTKVDGRWLSPEEQAKEQERSHIMAAKKKSKKKAKKAAKKKSKKKASKGEGIRQVVYFSADNAAVHKATAKYAAEQEQSFASVVVEALTSFLELE
jgi:hypothetical protein